VQGICRYQVIDAEEKQPISYQNFPLLLIDEKEFNIADSLTQMLEQHSHVYGLIFQDGLLIDEKCPDFGSI